MSENLETNFNLVITHETQLIHNASYDTSAERRDAAVVVLRSITDYVSAIDVLKILLGFGGASPDNALGHISALYAEEGVDVYLEDIPVNTATGPDMLYSVVTSYDHSVTNEVVHCHSLIQREDYLRNRLVDRGEAHIRSGVGHDYLAAKLQESLRADPNVTVPISIHLLTSLASGWSQS